MNEPSDNSPNKRPEDQSPPKLEPSNPEFRTKTTARKAATGSPLDLQPSQQYIVVRTELLGGEPWQTVETAFHDTQSAIQQIGMLQTMLVLASAGVDVWKKHRAGQEEKQHQSRQEKPDEEE